MEWLIREILSDAVEGDWGLFHIRSSVAGHFPSQTDETVIELCRTTMKKLIEDEQVTLYWLSTRDATGAEAAAERERLEVEVGLASSRSVFIPVRDDIPLNAIDAVLADGANWQPPIEDRYVAFSATEAGQEAYYSMPATGF